MRVDKYAYEYKRFLQGNRISGHNDTDAMQDRRDPVHHVGESISVCSRRCGSGYPAEDGRECAETEDETKRI